MDSDTKFNLIMLTGFLGFFLILTSTAIISQNVTHNCRIKAIEKGYTAAEIQAICR